MDKLKTSFEDVADWCERHLERQRGLEIGMTFGAMLRAYGRLATLPSRLQGEQRVVTERELSKKGEELLLDLSTRFIVAYGWMDKRNRVLEPTSICMNMSYDPGPQD